MYIVVSKHTLPLNIMSISFSVKEFVKLNVTLPIMIDRSLPQISLAAVVQVKVATFFKREGIFLLHFNLFHFKNLHKNMRHIIDKKSKMMCLILYILILVKKMSKRCKKLLKNFLFGYIKNVNFP